MSIPIVFAALSGALAVLGSWEAVAAVQDASPARLVRGLAAPLRFAREGREPSSAERLRMAVVASGTMLGAGWLMAGALAGAALACAAPWVMRTAVRARRRRWREDLAASAATVCRALADALSAGHSVRGAMSVASEGGGLGAAAGAEMRACAAALSLGQRTDAVLERLRSRASHPAYDTIAAVLMLHGTTGGPLASMLAGLATELEEARRVEADARTATAQARYTAGLVALLPAGAVGLAELGSPGTVGGILSSPLPALLALAGTACVVASLAVVARLARVTGV